jgi:hypothetical protein
MIEGYGFTQVSAVRPHHVAGGGKRQAAGAAAWTAPHRWRLHKIVPAPAERHR